MKIFNLITLGLSFALLTLPASTTAQTGAPRTHSGVIRSLNLKSRMLTVESSVEKLTFTVPTDAEIVVKDKPRGADLNDLTVGNTVEIKFTAGETSLIAHRIAILGLE